MDSLKIQKITFDLDKWNTMRALRWLTKFNLKPIKRGKLSESNIIYYFSNPNNLFEDTLFSNYYFDNGINMTFIKS